jgi:hypothetical protein
LSVPSDIEEHFAVFQKLADRAEDYLKKRNYNAAAVYAEIAAAYATHHHAGLYVSNRLEGILLSIGREIANRTSIAEKDSQQPQAPRRVLHVITEGAVIGGLTRMVWRWIQLDTQSCHSVVLTRPHKNTPQSLKDAVEATGGRVYRLNDKFGNILTWSQDLRKIAASVDVVVLHIYTWDVIPVIAFADKRSMPPVILLNQSDHKFWLGTSISDVVANQRYSGARLSQTRRAIDESRCGLLPIVLPPISRKLSIAEAKAKIGVSPDTLLLLSIARHSKYVPFRGYGSKFNDLVLPNSILPILKKYPNTALIVVGPESDERWIQASQSVQGRISALGTRADTDTFYQAADIYLDSFPFGSNTSCLEAGSYALPLVSCHPYSNLSDVLSADTPALDKSILRVTNRSEHFSVISRLIEDSEYRTRMGKVAQENILSIHTGENWLGYLQKLYLQAEHTPGISPVQAQDDQMIISELDILSLDIDILKVSEQMVAQEHIRLLPIYLRANHWLRLFTQHHIFKPSLLLSEWLAVQVIKAQDSIWIPKIKKPEDWA